MKERWRSTEVVLVLNSQWSLISVQFILGECSGQFLSDPSQFPLFLRTSWDRIGGIWVLGLLQPCCVTLTAAATCTAQKIRACAALASWDWCTNILFTALTGLSDMSLSIWLMFPSAADSSFYTKIIEWVFLVRKTRLFCSWVTFVWSSWIPLPRNSDILVKKDWKHLTGITFQRVCILFASTY